VERRNRECHPERRGGGGIENVILSGARNERSRRISSRQTGGLTMKREYYVYILSNTSRTLYIGVTSDLVTRIAQHKAKMMEGFSKRYNLTRLVYHESCGDVNVAIAREKQLKGWIRAKKIALIEERNPEWRDLSEDW
jgi:putative endonuclease